MDTYFAPAKKVDGNELATEIDIVSQNPVVTGLLQSISGLLAPFKFQKKNRIPAVK